MTTKHSFQEFVASNVHAQLKRERWSTRKAAEAMGWSDMYLSRRLRSKTAFDLNDLETLADLLKVDVRVFFEEPSVTELRSAQESKKGHYLTETLLSSPKGQKWPGRNLVSAPSFVTQCKPDICCNTMTLAA